MKRNVLILLSLLQLYQQRKKDKLIWIIALYFIFPVSTGENEITHINGTAEEKLSAN